MLNDKIREAITDGYNEEGGPFRLVKCPNCGYDYSHMKVRSLSPEDTGTRQAGYMVEFEFECGCPNVAYVFTEHKGRCVMGKIRETRRYVTCEEDDADE